MKCEICEGTGWVCENCGTRWELSDGGTCCGAGNPCVCNPNADFEFEAVIASTSPDEVKTWMN